MIDTDSKEGFPNLALMKLSAYHKARGDHVVFQKGLQYPLFDYDRAFLSCIFHQNADKARDLIAAMDNIVFGGSGFLPDFNIKLGSDIEHTLPDYDLYGVNFSMGFTSRGCFRKCKWCIVPTKEGRIQDHAPISEFLDPRHDRILLLDNNYQSSPKWRENLDFIETHDLKVNFNQGLDMRLVDREFAEALASVKYYDWQFKSRRLHFAFDTMAIEPKIEKGLEILETAGIAPHRLMFYILIGFNTTPEQDLYRIEKVTEWGSLPYVMNYNQNPDPKLKDIARWVNRRYYQFIPFEKYGLKKRRHLKPAESVEWGTPQDVFDELDAEFDFTVDVAASIHNRKCKRFYSIDNNGLIQDWSGERCFMNPPYGNDLREWTKKAYEESLKGALVVGLLPVRSDTAWFHDHVLDKAEIRFIRGRVKYEIASKDPSAATFPTMIVIWGH